jgi:pimeloyl-ACP methyl ester carboxylesterase
MVHGDGFAPFPTLANFGHHLEGFYYFDSFTGGGAETVLLVHGNGDEADTWRHVFTSLAARYRVVALDLPGFGRSEARGDGSVQTLARALEDFLDALRVERVHLVGSSLGAVVAAIFVARHPARGLSLTLGGGASPALGGVHANPGLKPLLEPGTGEAYYTGCVRAVRMPLSRPCARTTPTSQPCPPLTSSSCVNAFGRGFGVIRNARRSSPGCGVCSPNVRHSRYPRRCPQN